MLRASTRRVHAQSEDYCVSGAVEEVPVDMELSPRDVKSLWDGSPALVEAATAPVRVQVT